MVKIDLDSFHAALFLMQYGRVVQTEQGGWLSPDNHGLVAVQFYVVNAANMSTKSHKTRDENVDTIYCIASQLVFYVVQSAAAA